MKLNVFVTLFVPTVVMLASINMATAATSANAQAATSSTTLPAVLATPPPTDFHFSLSVSRSTNLVDFQDGSRGDSLDYAFSPSIKTSFGSFATSLSYSQNLRDQHTSTASDWGDIPLIFSFKPKTFIWLERNAKLQYSVTAVVPISQYSVKKDQLQTALNGKVGFSLMPVECNGIGFVTGISIGRSFHSFEEDINGSVLNQYSSNQNAGISYAYNDWSLSADFVNRTRWTYKNSVKSTFEISEEIGYSINSNFSAALGHTNAGSTLKANGADSNVDLYNENTSIVYATMGMSY